MICWRVVGAIIMVCAMPVVSVAQAVRSKHWIGRVESEDGSSEAYLARTPYTLRWRVDEKYKLYGKRDPTVKVDSYIAGVHVYDAASGRLIHSTGRGSLTGETKVPVAGRHRVKVFATGPWEASYEEDKEALVAASKRGELEDGKTVAEAARTSIRTKNEQVEKAKDEVLMLISRREAEVGKDAADALRADVAKAAQLAAGEDDFVTRFRVLSRATVERFQMRSAAPSAGGGSASTPQGSSWDGRGMPPGMMKR